MREPAESFAGEECLALFARLFPAGVAGDDVMQEIAPEGWERSPLLATFHPSVDQLYEEAVALHRNLESWRKKTGPADPEPTREAIAAEFREKPIDRDREVSELAGLCLWDVFSDNHEVVAADGRAVDLGSWRASGGFIADWLNRQAPGSHYDYLDFYMGSLHLRGRADLTPVYRMIFRRRERAGLDWIYHPPQLHLVDLRHVVKRPDDEAKKEDWHDYSPSEAFAAEVEEAERERAAADLRRGVDEHNRDLIERIRRRPPRTVLAYREVYGRFPQGWPPVSGPRD